MTTTRPTSHIAEPGKIGYKPRMPGFEMHRHPVLRRVRVLLGCGAFTLAAWGCSGDSKEEKILAAQLAEGCTLNSDCATPYVCVFARCHEACAKDVDCDDPLRCVRGATSD